MSDEQKSEEKPKYANKIKSTKEVIDDKLKDKKPNYGPENFYDKILNKWTTVIDDRVDMVEEAMMGTTYDIRRELRKTGGSLKDDSFKDITEKIYNSGIDVYKSIFKLEAGNEEGKKKLERMMERELPFDKEMIGKALKKSYDKTGKLNGDLLQQQVRHAYSTFERSLKGDVQEELRKKVMESPESFKEGKEYVEKLAKSMNEKLEADDLLGYENLMSKLFELAEKRKMMQSM